MSRKAKIWNLSLLWVAIVGTAVLATDSLVIRAILAVVLIGVTIHIFKVRTATTDKPDSSHGIQKPLS